MFVLPIMSNDCLQLVESHQHNADVEDILELQETFDAILGSLSRHMSHSQLVHSSIIQYMILALFV